MAQLPMPRPVPVMNGAIVTLRPFDPPADAADYYRMSLDPEMCAWTGNHALASEEEARCELERLAALPDTTQWAIVDNASSRMMGRFFVCLERRGGMLIAGEGNRITKPFWRRGHNREARRLVFQYVFGELSVDRFETQCWTDNVNSRESILAHDFRLVERATVMNPKYNRLMNKCVFEMSRDQWERSAKIEYRPFTMADEAECLDLMLRCVDCFEGVDEGAHPKLREHFCRKFSGEFFTSVFCLVAVDGGGLVGMGVLDGAEIRRMYVAPDLQRQGIGRTLFDKLEAEARRQGAESLQLHASMNAVAFYESVGFVCACEQTWHLDGLAVRNMSMTKDLR